MKRFFNNIFLYRMYWPFLLLFLMLPIFSVQTSIAGDSTLRCHGRLVSIEDTVSDVLDKCGEPDEISQREENHNSYISQIFDYEQDRYIAPMLIKGPILVELWTYDFGPTRFIRYLHFENSRLVKIETGGHAVNPNMTAKDYIGNKKLNVV